MNLYFLVEGDCTEKFLYPKWIEYSLPHMRSVEKAEDATENNYFIISGGGVPSIFEHISDAISSINLIKDRYDHFIIVLDSDGSPLETILGEVKNELEKNIINGLTKTHIIVQHPCIETWLLGNKRFYRKSLVNEELRDCLTFYNVFESDPELMGKPQKYPGSISNYHEFYLKKVFLSRTNGRMTYKKKEPVEAGRKHYWDSIVNRYVFDAHIKSFGFFFNFITSLR